MWTIPLFKVRSALSLKAARQREQQALDRALFLAGDDAELRCAIRAAVLEAQIAITSAIHADIRALSGAARAT